MNEEEYFRKNYPDSCYGDKPLSPHWDFFQDGVEFGERQSEKKIAELEKENAELKKRKEEIEIMTNFCKACKKMHTDSLTKAKEIIKKLIEAIHIWDCKNLEQVEAEAEQFLEELDNDKEKRT